MSTIGPTSTAAAAGKAVRMRRTELGLDQEDLAALADVSRKFVSMLEGGKQTVRLDKVDAVLHVLGLRLEPARADDTRRFNATRAN